MHCSDLTFYALRAAGGSTQKGGVLNQRRPFKTGRRKKKKRKKKQLPDPSIHLFSQITQHPPVAHQRATRRENTKMAPISIKTVLISESVDPRCKTILEENGIRVTEKQNMTKDELIAEIKVVMALCVILRDFFTCTRCRVYVFSSYQAGFYKVQSKALIGAHVPLHA